MTFECIRLISFSWLIGLTPEGGQTQYPLDHETLSRIGHNTIVGIRGC